MVVFAVIRFRERFEYAVGARLWNAAGLRPSGSAGSVDVRSLSTGGMALIRPAESCPVVLPVIACPFRS